MTKFYLVLIFVASILSVHVCASSKRANCLIAFPTAEGWGKYSCGGRGGKVIKVTNLNDHGLGSLRYAIDYKGARIVVFDVDGTISLETPLRITNDSITIAGQTAPGDGICLKDCPLSINASNVIIRYIRVRVGDKYPHDYDSVTGGGYGQHDVIVDHVSASWSIDECFSLYKTSNLTVQWCMISQSLAKSHHTKGAHGFGGIWGGKNATWHHNLLADNTSRNPRFSSVANTKNVDFRNNVVWNYGFKAAYGGGEYGEINFVGNYYKPGPASIRPHLLDVSEDGTSLYFISGNVIEKCDSITTDNWKGVGGPNPMSSFVGHPFEYEPIKEQMPMNMYDMVLEQVGCSQNRDSYDCSIIKEVRTGKPAFSPNGIINSQTEVGGWPKLKIGKAKKDSDNDGMPDSFEDKYGLDKNNPNDASQIAENGYANIENYIFTIDAKLEKEY